MAKKRKTKGTRRKRKMKGGKLTGARIRAVGNYIAARKNDIVSGLQKAQLVSRGLSALANTGKLGAATPYVNRAASFAAQRGFGMYLPTKSGRGLRRMSGMHHRLY